MKMPWVGKTGLAKAASIFATLAIVSLGLCGANWIGWLGIFRFLPNTSRAANGISLGLTVAAYLELAGIVIGIVGLLVVAAAMLLTFAIKGPQPKDREE